MKERDNISDIYRKQVEELLENQSDSSLLHPLDPEEMDLLWEEMSTELDIGEVWTDIASELDIVMPVASPNGLILKTAAAVLIILAGLIPVRKAILDSYTGQPGIVVETRPAVEPSDLIISDIPGDSAASGEKTEGDISTEIRSSAITSQEVTENAQIKSEVAANSPETIKPAVHIFDYHSIAGAIISDSNIHLFRKIIPLNESDTTRIMHADDLGKVISFAGIDFDQLHTNEISPATGNSLPITGRGLISGGLITSLKNTWLLSNETLAGLKSESLNSSEVVFFPDVGLSLNYSLNKTWLIQADGFFFSNTGQQYYEYIYGHYSSKKITLRYAEISLSVKRRFAAGILFMPGASLNLLAGSYVAVLNNAKQIIGSDPEDVMALYRKLDYGVRFGGEYEIPVSDRFSLAPGLIMSLGIPNIYAGSIKIPGHLKQTHNGSAEFQLSFYYHFH